MSLRKGLPLLVALVLALASAAPASATTFCVPGFHANCPSGGGNVAQPNLETAMNTSGDDGQPDRILIWAGTPITQNNEYGLGSGDNDDLEIAGAGPASSVITSTATGNVFMMNLNSPRAVTMRDLTLRIPASFDDGLGGAMQAEQDTFENVDVESRNAGSDGISAIGGSDFRDGRLYGSNGGSIDNGFDTNGAESGALEIDRTSIESPSWGVLASTAAVPVFLRQSRITNPVAYGVRTSSGGIANVSNSVIELSDDDSLAVDVDSNTAGAPIVTLRHVTIFDDGNNTYPAVRAVVATGAGKGPINLVTSDLIIDGNDTPFWRQSLGAADADLTVAYSYFPHSVYTLGPGDLNVNNNHNIDTFTAGSPLFKATGDYHLLPASKAIDSGDPLTATLPTIDFDGAPRPVDGNGDGVARRDMGAYEYQPPVVTPPADPGAGQPKDTIAPTISKLRLRKRKFEVTLSEAATVVITATKSGATKSKKAKPVKLTYSGKAGLNKFKLKKGKLKAGKFKLSAVATDSAGNKSKPKTSRAKIKR